MNKYEVEDNIDFYEQLKKSMDNDDDEDSRETHCLITNLPLIEPYITNTYLIIFIILYPRNSMYIYFHQ